MLLIGALQTTADGQHASELDRRNFDMIARVAVVVPVLDDWDSFSNLLEDLSLKLTGSDAEFHIVAIDDGSSQPFDVDRITLQAGNCIADVEIVHLALNLGHQRAIAVGLAQVAVREDIDAVVVMDSDCEDRPEDIAPLLAESRSHAGHVVLAHRAKRSETRTFRVGYLAYKALFRALTGRSISFGNFSLLPMAAVRRIVHMPELWNNLPAAIMRSRLNYTTIPTVRGRRYAGQSKMNYVALAVHGLSAMSTYTDTIFVRVLVAAGLVALALFAGIFVATLLRFTTDLAIPGWTTVVVSALVTLLMQTMILVVATALMILAGRSSRPMLPIVDCHVFVASRERRVFRRITEQVRTGIPA